MRTADATREGFYALRAFGAVELFDLALAAERVLSFYALRAFGAVEHHHAGRAGRRFVSMPCGLSVRLNLTMPMMDGIRFVSMPCGLSVRLNSSWLCRTAPSWFLCPAGFRRG